MLASTIIAKLCLSSINWRELRSQKVILIGSSRENKSALSQLISHTKNVERAVTMNQQDLMQRKEAQATK